MHSAITPPDFRLPPEQVPETVVEQLAGEERDDYIRRIKHLLREQDAVLVAHYYTDPDLQLLADETGGHVSDSLDMARFGHESNASTLVVCGVRFMGETAKILNPEKRVLMPDLHADCSLDIGCPIDEFNTFCNSHPDRIVVVYANTSAAVKARADWMVTSGSAVDVVRHLAGKGEKIIWAPDKYLGEYVQEQSGADMVLWQGSCIVHEEFKGGELAQLKGEHPRRQGAGAPGVPGAGHRPGRRGQFHHGHHQGGKGTGRGYVYRRNRPGHLLQNAAGRPGQDLHRSAHSRPGRNLQELRALSVDGNEQPHETAGYTEVGRQRGFR